LPIVSAILIRSPHHIGFDRFIQSNIDIILHKML
jgi:hypothetical protein